jgi:processive 1,2-diacylglycerol beta-glucosyltransferase
VKSTRVLVLTAEEGEGHRSVGAALAAELAGEATEVVVLDVFQEGFSRIVAFFSRDLYRIQLRWFAWSYAVEYWLFTRVPPARAFARLGLALLGSRATLRLIGEHDPDVVVSTHVAVTGVLGHLRRKGRLSTPIVATVTDLGVHPLWAHPGVDLHLVAHESSVAAVERVAGSASARVVRPIVAPDFRRRGKRSAARKRLDLPLDGPVVLVSGGGWGVGNVGGTVSTTLAVVPDATVVCVCGRNERLRRRLLEAHADDERVRVLGFSELMPDLLTAADVLIDSTVGVTCLEALACGRPIVVYGASPGHSRDNARMLERLGLGRSPRSPQELAAALKDALADGTAARVAAAPSAAALIVATAVARL